MMKQVCICTALLLSMFVLQIGVVQADIDPATVQKLLADDGAYCDQFGNSVSIFDDTALIGAKGDGGNKGAAYVFVRSRDGIWIQQSKLTASDGAAGTLFGLSLSVFGDTALIGAIGDDDKGEYTGSAYVFVRAEDGTWTQQAKLTAEDGDTGDYFGRSISLFGDTALIGAIGNDDKGSVYVFTRSETGWTQKAKLTADDGTARNHFGWSAALNDDTALIGVYGNDGKGAAYVFARSGDDTWNQQAKLISSDVAAGDWFGSSVSLDGNIALIGAHGDDDNGDYSGSVYIFARSGDGTWSQQAKLIASDGAGGDWFGYAVSLDGETALIGARGDDDEGDMSGSVYVFVRSGTTWIQKHKLTADGSTANNYFGTSVSLDGDIALIGASSGTGASENSGAAYIYNSPSANGTAISTCSELQAINNNLSSSYYLANDIDCAGFDFGDGGGFMPIGDGDTPFAGTFDGKGFTISNVFIDRPYQTYYVGLFGFAGLKDDSASVTISNVNLTGLDITGNSHVGGLFGQLYHGTVTDVHTEGDVRGVGVIGGLGGDARYSTISNTSSSGLVETPDEPTGSTSLIFYGGLIGGNEITEISCSNSDADVTGNYRVGGLVGTNSGTITASFATGTVKGFYRVGGLAGENVSGRISNCFATGSVTGFGDKLPSSHELGGLVGLQFRDSRYADGSEPVIENSYATGKITGGYNMGGILGRKFNGSCSDTYWDVDTSEISGDACGVNGSSGLTTDEMQDQITYVGWDFDNTWTMNDYPILQCDAGDNNTDPVADAGENQSVVQGDTVCFDGSGSSDADNDELSYLWSLTEWPAGSSAVLDNPTVDNPCIIADLPGTYQVSLTVNDGIIDSAPSTAEVVAISYLDAAKSILQELLETVKSLDPAVFKNDRKQGKLIKRVNKVIVQVDKGKYKKAVKKIRKTLKKTNGCAASGTPDKNDWIKCEGQEQVYPLLEEAIGYLKNI